jgi:hypothetical protein
VKSENGPSRHADARPRNDAQHQGACREAGPVDDDPITRCTNGPEKPQIRKDLAARAGFDPHVVCEAQAWRRKTQHQDAYTFSYQTLTSARCPHLEAPEPSPPPLLRNYRPTGVALVKVIDRLESCARTQSTLPRWSANEDAPSRERRSTHDLSARQGRGMQELHITTVASYAASSPVTKNYARETREHSAMVQPKVRCVSSNLATVQERS